MNTTNVTVELVNALKSLAGRSEQDEFTTVAPGMPEELRTALKAELQAERSQLYRDLAKKLLGITRDAESLKAAIVQEIRGHRAAEKRALARLRNLEQSTHVAQTQSNYLPLVLLIAPEAKHLFTPEEVAALDRLLWQATAETVVKPDTAAKSVKPAAKSTPLRQRTRAG